MLKVGYDKFEVTKRPPEVEVCEKKYVFNQQTGGTFNAERQMPCHVDAAGLAGRAADL